VYPGPRETEAREDQKDLATSWIRFLSSDRKGDKENEVTLEHGGSVGIPDGKDLLEIRGKRELADPRGKRDYRDFLVSEDLKVSRGLPGL